MIADSRAPVNHSSLHKYFFVFKLVCHGKVLLYSCNTSCSYSRGKKEKKKCFVYLVYTSLNPAQFRHAVLVSASLWPGYALNPLTSLILEETDKELATACYDVCIPQEKYPATGIDVKGSWFIQQL